ncbi:MAG: DUF1538 domain-containing protein [Marinobacter sp.]|nr:DUF1538 domain-containing protein [Marinobacter sp.]
MIIETLLSTTRDIMPIAAIIFSFQFLVLRKPLARPVPMITGFVMVWIGLSLFLVGLEVALFPIGTLMAEQLLSVDVLPLADDHLQRHWSDYYWVYLFAFSIGAAATIAEPALIAVSLKAGEVSSGAINPLLLRIAVATGMAFGITLGTWRIVTGLPLYGFIIAAYLVVIIQTLRAPKNIIPLAYDSGGVTTSTITVPIIAALGIGLANVIPGRDPLVDGFGMIALACLFPIITVMGYAQLAAWYAHRIEARVSEPSDHKD